MTSRPRLFEVAALGELAIFGQPKMATRDIQTQGATQIAQREERERERECVCVCVEGGESSIPKMATNPKAAN